MWPAGFWPTAGVKTLQKINRKVITARAAGRAEPMTAKEGSRRIKACVAFRYPTLSPPIRKDKNRPRVSWPRGSARFVEAARGWRRPRAGIRAGHQDARVDRPLRVRGPRLHRTRGPRIRERGDDRRDGADPPDVRVQGPAEPLPERFRHLHPRAADDLQAGGAQQGQGSGDRPPRGHVREARHAPRGFALEGGAAARLYDRHEGSRPREDRRVD